MADKGKRKSSRGKPREIATIKSIPADRAEELSRIKAAGAVEEQPSGSPAREPATGDGRARRSLPVRIAIRTLKVLFFWVPVSIISLVLLVLLGLELYLSPGRVEKLIVENFNSRSYGDISLNVRSFSPFGGFVMENILIRNGKEFDNSRFVEIKKLVLDYGLFPILIGNVRFREIGIYQPRIYLTERGGVWNAARLMKPGEPKKEEKEEEEPEEDKGPPPDQIKLPISVEFLFKFVLDDLRVYVDGTKMKSALEGLTFGIDIWVPPFDRVPTSLEAVSILDRMKIELNPREEMNVTFTSSEAEVRPPLVLTWKLLYNKKDPSSGKPQFESRLKLGTYRTPVRFKRVHLAPLSFMVSYDLFYEPSADFLRLNSLGVDFAGRKLLNLAGEVREVTKKQRFDLRMTESDISLTDLYPYYRSVTGDSSMRFAGNVSLYPLTVRGDPKNIDVDGRLGMKNIYFRNPAIEARVPWFNLGYSVSLRGDDLNALANLRIPHFNYVLKRGKSGDNGLSLGVSAAFNKKTSKARIHNVALNFYNPESGKDALRLVMNGLVDLKPVPAGNIKISTLRFQLDPLLGMLPRSQAKKLSSIPLKNPVDLTLDAVFNAGKEIITAGLGVTVKVPDFKVTDLALDTNILMNNPRKRLNINRMNLASRAWNLNLDVDGVVDLDQAPGRDTDVKVKLNLDIPQLREMYQGWMLSGSVELAARQKGDLKKGTASGAVKIARFNVKNAEKKTDVADFNLNFPFEYNHHADIGESRIAVDKSVLIDSPFFREKENFTIRSIKGKHLSRDIAFEFIKDFSSTMFFRNNTFEIPTMKAYVMGGSLYGRNILFALADLKPDNMEYNLTLDVTNIDIGLLDDPDPKFRKRDAELSLNAQFKGRGLNLKKELTPAGYVNIHKIGDRFANKLLKGLSTEKGKSKLGIAQFPVDNSLMVDGFNFNMDKGLVYTTVSFRRKAIGWILGIEQDKVQFDRIKVQEYLRNILGGS
jgi:hypothetical protein